LLVVPVYYELLAEIERVYRRHLMLPGLRKLPRPPPARV